jgi:hypothetical protein
LGITGNVTLVRAGTLREQLAESTINLSTVPYPIFDGNGKPNKAKLTKYSNFEAETGGLYILNSNGELVPARIEMDIYSSQHVLSKIVETLAPHLDGFDYQIREFKKALHSQYDQAVNELSSDISESISELYSDYFRAIREERNRIDLEIIKRGAEENAAIRELRKHIDELERIRYEKTEDLYNKRETLDKVEGYVSAQIDDHISDSFSYLSFLTPDELMEEIERNGGWQHWANEVGIEKVTRQDFIRAGLTQWHFRPSPGFDARERIKDWLVEQLEPDYYYTDLPEDFESPTALIEQWFNKSS